MMDLYPADITILELIGALVLLVSPIVVIMTFRRNINVTRLQMCHDIAERHMELMWLTVDKPALNGVWNRIPKDRLLELSQAQSRGRWGAWHAMSEDERALYRFARRALEHVEQAYDAHQHGWMPDYLWNTWASRLEAWRDCDYCIFIAGDLRHFKDSAFFRNNFPV